MSLSSVCVVTNALRLKKFESKIKFNETTNKMDDSNSEEERIMNIKTIVIEGMQCNHCKMMVEKILEAIDGVEKVEVNLENKTATIEMSKEVEDAKIKEVVEEAGFILK